MVVLLRVVHDLSYVVASMLEDIVFSTGMVIQKGGDIVDLSGTGNPAACLGVAPLDVLRAEDTETL
jgi:hypothetical protein